MAVSYDTSLVYCAEGDVFRYGDYDWDASSSPTDSEVYDYAQDVAAQIESKTETAGNRITPTQSLTEATRVKRVLEQTNAVGAAMLARHQMYTKSGSDRDLRIWESLARQYEALMGPGSSAAGVMAGGGTTTDGIVGDVVSSEADTGLLANEVTQGEVTLKTLSGTEARTNVEPEFTTEDVD